MGVKVGGVVSVDDQGGSGPMPMFAAGADEGVGRLRRRHPGADQPGHAGDRRDRDGRLHLHRLSSRAGRRAPGPRGRAYHPRHAARRHAALRLRPPRRVRGRDGGGDRPDRAGRPGRAPHARHRAAGRAAGRAGAGARAAVLAGRHPRGRRRPRRRLGAARGGGRDRRRPAAGRPGQRPPDLRRRGGAAASPAAYEIANRALFLEPVSRTFHGRDVFAPVAAHLAAGVDGGRGRPADRPGDARAAGAAARASSTRGTCGRPRWRSTGSATWRCRCADPTSSSTGFASGARIEISAGAGRYYALRARTFADVRVGEMVVFDDSSGWAALAMNSGSIIEICDITRGDMVDLRLT